MITLLILSSLVFSPHSPAAIDPVFSCAPPSQLRVRAKSCGDNSEYTDAAKACLDRYDAQVSATRARLAKSLEPGLAASAQQGSMKNASGDYSAAVSELKRLATQGEKLHLQLKGYKSEVVLPDEFGQLGPRFQPGFALRTNHCYSDTQKLLGTYTKLMESRSKEVSLIARIAGQLQRRTRKGEGNLSSVLPLLSGGKVSSGAPLGAKPAAKEKASTITGKVKKNPK